MSDIIGGGFGTYIEPTYEILPSYKYNYYKAMFRCSVCKKNMTNNDKGIIFNKAKIQLCYDCLKTLTKKVEES